jgi:putative methyltransferase (TIGR04325 family)
MTRNLREVLRPLVPPIVLDALRGMRGSVLSFSGDYSSWDEAQAAAIGYDSGEILARVASATRAVVRGEAAYERDSVLFDQIEYSWPVLASLLRVAVQMRSLRVIDFGGSLGSSWRQNRPFLEDLDIALAWRVVEQDHFVDLGRKEFATNVLGFDRSIAEAAGAGADVVLFSSSLCYLDDPMRFLREAASVAPYIIIDRLPLIAGSRDRIALQTVTEPIYNATYPIRLFAAAQIETRLLPGWRQIERWDCDLQPDADSRCTGFFLVKP